MRIQLWSQLHADFQILGDCFNRVSVSLLLTTLALHSAKETMPQLCLHKALFAKG